jgi:hypothetical protein
MLESAVDAETSSANPNALFAYAETGLRIDAQLEATAARLAVALDEFTATCREYSLGIDSSLAHRLRDYARRTSEHDLWVRRVAEQFVQADQGVAPDEGVIMGTLESSTSVAGWSAPSKIDAALERALSRLPAALAEQLRAMLTPENVAALVAILGVWAASQAVGVGEVVDLILAVGGAIMLGPEAIRAVQELAGFATDALGAQSDGDLDRAGEHLANAVTIVGVDGAVALLAHKAGGMLGDRVPRIAGPSTEAITPEGVRVPLAQPGSGDLMATRTAPTGDVVPAAGSAAADADATLAEPAPRPGAPGSPEHKAARWAAYQERGGSWSYEHWSAVYDANMPRAKLANEAADAYHQTLGLGEREVKVVTPEGAVRVLDIADEDLQVAVEYRPATRRPPETTFGKSSVTRAWCDAAGTFDGCSEIGRANRC